MTVRCWSLETGRCLKLYQGHERTVTCLAVFLDLIAAGGNDNLCLGKEMNCQIRHVRYERKHLPSVEK